MALGGGKKDLLTAENAAMKTENRMLKERCEEYREEIRELKESLRRTQDALIAKEAPEAYRDHIHARERAKDEELTEGEKAEMEIAKQQARYEEKFLQEIERPLFKDAEDMISILSRPEGPPVPGSLHNDGES